MACERCIARQRKLVQLFCGRKPFGSFCFRAKERLAKMEGTPLPVYQNRMMTSDNSTASSQVVVSEPEPAEVEVAPYGYKVDGTPRKRPGRAPADK